MSFTKFLMEQQEHSTKKVTTKLKEGGNLDGNLQNQLENINNELEDLLGRFLRTLKSSEQEWGQLTDDTGYFPPKTKVSSGIWSAQREIADALDHLNAHMREQG